MDDFSVAELDIANDEATDLCCEALSQIEPWLHELLLYRDEDLVWVGPLTEPTFTDERAIIRARDLFSWFERRVLPSDRRFLGEDLATIFFELATDALSRDTSPNISFTTIDTGITGVREYRTADQLRAGDELRELARSGVDFTMIARQMIVGGREIPIGVMAPLTDQALISGETTIRGLEAATEVTVLGETDSRTGITPSTTARDQVARYGLLEKLSTELSVQDNASAEAAAQGRLSMFIPPPSFLRVVLAESAPYDFADLVPGRVVDARVQIGCRKVEETLRLSEVMFEVAASEEEATEQISALFIPEGLTDAVEII